MQTQETNQSFQEKYADKKKRERIVTLYMQALGGAELPEEVWKKIAKVNKFILDQ